MAYNSIHTGPELDAAVTMLGDIQDARDATAADRQVVETLAPQVEQDAQTASDAAAAAEADRIAAQEAATQAQESAAGVAVLRSDLADPDKGAAMVAYGGGTVADTLDLLQPWATAPTQAEGRAALGLGSAATADAGDFDPAGSAANALSSANWYTDSLVGDIGAALDAINGEVV